MGGQTPGCSGVQGVDYGTGVQGRQPTVQRANTWAWIQTPYYLPNEWWDTRQCYRYGGGRQYDSEYARERHSARAVASPRGGGEGDRSYTLPAAVQDNPLQRREGVPARGRWGYGCPVLHLERRNTPPAG